MNVPAAHNAAVNIFERVPMSWNVRRWSFIRNLITALLATALLWDSTAHAQSAPGLRLGGQLVDDQQVPVEGEVSVTTTLYAMPDGLAEDIVWSQQQVIDVVAGEIEVMLGDDDDAFGALFVDHRELYLGVAIEDDEEMRPLIRLGSSPWAHFAGAALSAENATGDITPASVSIPGVGMVIDENGQWVGDIAGLQGPAGADGADGALASTGLTGRLARTAPMVQTVRLVPTASTEHLEPTAWTGLQARTALLVWLAGTSTGTPFARRARTPTATSCATRRTARRPSSEVPATRDSSWSSCQRPAS